LPELPEVETTLRGIEPALTGRTINEVIVRNASLRWPVPEEVSRAQECRVVRCWRRAKYLLIELDRFESAVVSATGGLLIHLGMSGSLRICEAGDAPRKHDHVDIVLDSGKCIRFNDPRRFGVFSWWDPPAQSHKLLRDLGPEPLSEPFLGNHLWQKSRGRKAAVKNFIMDGKIVVGVGNIYASEALYMAGIHPMRSAGRVSAARYEALAAAVRDVLNRAIRLGGTTLRDFSNTEGSPGYFARELLVYERQGLPCFQCQAPVRRKVIGQRSSYYCPRCQR
jgi:formamidopyrimidine-DNA glycosylase